MGHKNADYFTMIGIELTGVKRRRNIYHLSVSIFFKRDSLFTHISKKLKKKSVKRSNVRRITIHLIFIIVLRYSLSSLYFIFISLMNVKH